MHCQTRFLRNMRSIKYFKRIMTIQCAQTVVEKFEIRKTDRDILKKSVLKAQPEKKSFFRRVHFLVHVLSTDGVQPNRKRWMVSKQ